jgi:8-oxo-dGTP diphosphatase
MCLPLWQSETSTRKDALVDIRIAAAAIVREDGATLLVRKRGASAFMQPGGKIDADETPVNTLRRELLEELALDIQPESAEYLGRFSAPAANEADCTVTAEMFRVEFNGDVRPQAEIDEVRWLLPEAQSQLNLAPLMRDMVLPAIWR